MINQEVVSLLSTVHSFTEDARRICEDTGADFDECDALAKVPPACPVCCAEEIVAGEVRAGEPCGVCVKGA